MKNIKINDAVINNVDIVDSGDVLGLHFVSAMSFAELEALFTPATSPEFRIVNLIETDVTEEVVVGVYKNRKLLSVKVTANDNDNTVEIVLQVTPAKIEEVEALTKQVNEQAAIISEQNAAIEAQAAANDEQSTQIAEQASVIEAQEAKITAQETEINNLKNALTDAEAKIIESEAALAETQANLAETQAANDMLMECVLEISEVVYA